MLKILVTLDMISTRNLKLELWHHLNINVHTWYINLVDGSKWCGKLWIATSGYWYWGKDDFRGWSSVSKGGKLIIFSSYALLMSSLCSLELHDTNSCIPNMKKQDSFCKETILAVDDMYSVSPNILRSVIEHPHMSPVREEEDSSDLQVISSQP